MSISLLRVMRGHAKKTVAGAIVLAIVVSGWSLPVRSVGQGSNARALPPYEAIIDPFVDAGETMLMMVSLGTGLGLAGSMGVVMIEANRLFYRTMLGIFDFNLDNAVAVAITTNMIKDYRIATDADVQTALLLITKLKNDLQFYEKKYPAFAKADLSYRPATRGEQADWDHYATIKKALREFNYRRDNVTTHKTEFMTLKNAENTLITAAEEMRKALMTVLAAFQKAMKPLTTLTGDSGHKYITARLEPLHEAIFGIGVMADTLSDDGETPKTQLRFILTNASKDLVFFVQVQEKKDDGTYAVRPDTRYPFPVYNNLIDPQSNPPKVLPIDELKLLQIPPYGPRAGTRSELWRPIKPGDKIIIRVATMGIVRDRIRFMPLKSATDNVQPDLNSFSRGFYYLGYESIRPPAISRWYSLEETYSWRLQGGWAKGESQHDPVLASTDGKLLRGFTCPGCSQLTLSNDRIEWILPDTMKDATQLQEALATITGISKYIKIGPKLSVGQPQSLEERGSGDLSLLIQAW